MDSSGRLRRAVPSTAPEAARDALCDDDPPPIARSRPSREILSGSVARPRSRRVIPRFFGAFCPVLVAIPAPSWLRARASLASVPEGHREPLGKRAASFVRC